MIGRKTNGGLVMMSSPLIPPLPPGRTPEACDVLVGEDDGVVSVGEEGGVGAGLGAPWRLKRAHGLGWTLAHSLWTAGLSPANGVTGLVKAPLSSVTTDAATWADVSQYSVMLSFFKKFWPVALMLVVGPPAVGSNPMVAPPGRGAYTV